MRSTVAIACALFTTVVVGSARADEGAPPPDASTLVSAPKDAAAAPTIASPTHETTATVSAGGQLATGNSSLLAVSLNGKFDMRRAENGFGASLVGNYGQSAPPEGDWNVTTENLQGRLRYDRYLADRMSLFLIGTARHDRFEGLDVRFNVDPGAKYLFVNADATKLWGEVGYDFQYDINRTDAITTIDPTGVAPPTRTGDKTKTDHSARVFVGFRQTFNKDVTFSTGIEYLQSFVESTQYRINYDALLAANLGAGFSFGAGFSLRFDHDPLADKKDLDTSTTFSVIYTFSDAAPPPVPPPPPCNCPPPPPPAPPTAPATETNTPPPAPASIPAPSPTAP